MSLSLALLLAAHSALASQAGEPRGAVDWRDPIPSGGLMLVGAGPVRLVGQRVEVLQQPPEKEEWGVARFAVEYRLRNDGRAPVDAEAVLRAPPRQWFMTEGARGIGAPTLAADGVVLRGHRQVLARLGEADVTQALASLGVAADRFPDAWEDGLAAFWKPLGPDRYAKLVAAGLVNGGRHPEWRVEATDRWRVRFPAGAEVKLRLEYAAVPGCCEQDVGQVEQDACRTRDSLRPFRSRNELDIVLQTTWPAFELAPVATGAPTIPSLEVVVRTLEGWQAAFCWDGAVERTSPTTWRASGKDVAPGKPLKIFLLSPR